MADLAATLRPYVDSGAVPGLVALVARDDDVEVVTLGTQDSSGVPMARDSMFRAASITKPVTAALTMTLVDDGLVDLDAPLGEPLRGLDDVDVHAAGVAGAGLVEGRGVQADHRHPLDGGTHALS